MSLYHVIVNRFAAPVIAQHEATGMAKGRAEGRVEGQVEGRAAANREWQDWLRRRADAEAKGEPFTEPPPGDAPSPEPSHP